MSPLLYDEVPEPPLPQEGGAPKATEEQCQIFLSLGVPQGFAQLLSGEGAKRFVMCQCDPFLLTGIYEHSGH